MRWSVHEIWCWTASRAIVTPFTLTRAAVFCGHQSVHTRAQLRQETPISHSRQFWSGDNPVKTSAGAMARFAWCNTRRKVTPFHLPSWEWRKRSRLGQNPTLDNRRASVDFQGNLPYPTAVQKTFLSQGREEHWVQLVARAFGRRVTNVHKLAWYVLGLWFLDKTS